MKVAFFGQVLDRIAAMQQHALVAVDIGDAGLAGGGRGEARIVGEHAGLRRRACARRSRRARRCRQHDRQLQLGRCVASVRVTCAVRNSLSFARFSIHPLEYVLIGPCRGLSPAACAGVDRWQNRDIFGRLVGLDGASARPGPPELGAEGFIAPQARPSPRTCRARMVVRSARRAAAGRSCRSLRPSSLGEVRATRGLRSPSVPVSGLEIARQPRAFARARRRSGSFAALSVIRERTVRQRKIKHFQQVP